MSPLDLLGLITGLPAETARIPWDGPQVRIIEHQAHAPGHAALLIEERGVLVPGHGSIGGADQVPARIDRDRAYVHALRDAHVPSDSRVGPSATYGKDLLPGVIPVVNSGSCGKAEFQAGQVACPLPV
jgi:glyoxylase-like metal-dependent hydrolase (beta-lactamase superfamily II)